MEKIKELEKLIKRHKVLYYQGRPEISDYEYDDLESQLQQLDPDNPVLQIVGSETISQEKVQHDKKMLSLGKTYKEEELISWMKEYEVVSTYKIDGVSCSIVYRDGKLVLAKTRGNGTFGENITAKVMWMDSVPKTITETQEIEVRGELYCTEEKFFSLSEEMEKLSLEKPTSQRNIVAGLISRKENIELCRYISFTGFDYLEKDHRTSSSEYDKHLKLQEQGFEVLEMVIHKNSSQLHVVLEDARNFMANGEYQIDGLVFSYNDLALQDSLGETAHHPRYKMAFKFKGESKVTTIKKIIWSISRNGVLTPVANVEPVELSGAKISRVTLHNYGMVKQHNLKRGDQIEIIRSGEVIPKFLSVATPSENEFEIPGECPSCESPINIEGIRLFCSNEYCPGKLKEGILNFIQKIGVDDLSSKRLEELIRLGLVRKISDLYKLKSEDFLKLDKFQEKLSNKIVSSINSTKKTTLVKMLGSIGITGGAYNKCEKIVQAGFDKIEKIQQLTTDQLKTVESFADKSASDFVSSLKEKLPLIDELLELGFSFEQPATNNQDLPLTGKKLCITGALSEKRSVIEERIRNAGGHVVGSVSKNLDYLVCNETESTSSKMKKAKSLEIDIISEAQLMELL